MCKSNKLTSPFVKSCKRGFVGGFDTTFAHAKQGFDPLAPLLVVKSSKEKKLSPTPSTSQRSLKTKHSRPGTVLTKPVKIKLMISVPDR